MDRILAAFCGFGLGVLAGLGIAVLTQPALRAVEAERDAAREELRELRAVNEDGEKRLTEALARAEGVSAAAKMIAENHRDLQDAVEQLADNEFRSQALLGLVIYRPEMRLLLTDPILDEEDRGWYAPEESWKFFYGSDIKRFQSMSVKELDHQGLKARAMFRATTAAAPGESYRSRLEMAKVGVRLMPELEKARKQKAAQEKNRAT